MKAEMSDEEEHGDGDVVRMKSKQKNALLRELTSTLVVRAERIRLQQRNEQLQVQNMTQGEIDSGKESR